LIHSSNFFKNKWNGEAFKTGNSQKAKAASRKMQPLY
jgi:hypothetical protein